MGFRDRIAKLASSATGGTPDPQGRDQRWFGTFFRDANRREPDSGDIEGYVEDYEECPLVSVPIDNYPADVLEPGYRFETENEQLMEELEEFFSEAAIEAGEFGQDFGTILEDQVRDNVLRGTGLAEVVYDDAETQEQIVAFRLFRAETVTAYTRPGQAILLRPDDEPAERTAGGSTRTAPETKAGETAAYVQFDDVFGSGEPSEVAFSTDDVVKIVNNPDTGDVFGRSDVKGVHERVRGLLQKLTDVDEAIAAKAYAFWLFKFGEESNAWPKEKAKGFMQDQKAENYGPGKKEAVPGDVSIETISGEVPQVWESFQYDVEYILSGLPGSKYQVGFSDNTNRDIAEQQSESYDERVSGERRKLEAAWQPVVDRVAEQLGYSSDDVELVIEPEQDESPLANPNFDPQEFKQTMQGIKQAAPGGAVEQVITPETIVDVFLKLDPDEVMPDEDEQEQPLDESNPQVQRQMQMLEDAMGGGGDAPPGAGGGNEPQESPPQEEAPQEEPAD